jgi:hypothetical protein
MDEYSQNLIKIGFFITLFSVIMILGIFYLYRAFGNVKWPPESQKCPDHWAAKDASRRDVDAVGTDCVDVYNLVDGSDSCTSTLNLNSTTTRVNCAGHKYYMNAEEEEQTGVWQDLCDKKAWADGNNLTWDGITNTSYDCN